VLYRISHGEGRPQDLDMLLSVGNSICPGLNAPFSQTTICPLGPSAVSAVVSLNRYFRDEIIAMSTPVRAYLNTNNSSSGTHEEVPA
ncbi:MAG TPA: NADH-ubiquinone oxidoreductase-F iron-sulfur binding region domain-containing protein, partial [Acidimicrobiia bacterium]|nr:NADH-ubiquinone oxidoreductase-F iron-sulfur binding region domain-containing protein [Acidimicrobiia bacterium]